MHIRSIVGRILYYLRKGYTLLFREPLRHNMRFIPVVFSAYFASCLCKTKRPKIVIGTHHKVMTMFMISVFREFAYITNRSILIGSGSDLDYDADIIFDHHSQFDFSRLGGGYLGMHFRRDPRDLVVSSGFYHMRSNEEWLHVPKEEFGGLTYQEYVNTLVSMEEVLMFEIDQSAGCDIRDMLKWDYSRGFIEFKYEDLVNQEGGEIFSQGLEQWPLSYFEKSLLEGLFDYYSIYGRGGKKSKHVRNPISRQFEEHFSTKLHRKFDVCFPGAIEKLGYE